MVRLAQAGATVPEIGPELADDKGRVVADAEMIWGAAHVAVLRLDQADMAKEWTAQGWAVLCLDEALTQCMAQPWEKAVATALGLTIGNQE
jgi:DEAD/DEAH box helicase domain-containing protein